MGTYSKYTIIGNWSLEESEKILNKLKEISGYIFYYKNDIIKTNDEIKWYNFDEDMISLSECFPKVRFKLFREHEEGDDMELDGSLKSNHTYMEFENGENFLYEIKIFVEAVEEKQ